MVSGSGFSELLDATHRSILSRPPLIGVHIRAGYNVWITPGRLYFYPPENDHSIQVVSYMF